MSVQAWSEQWKRLSSSARYRALSAAGHHAGPCVEGAIVSAVAPEKSLPQVVNRLPEIYREIITSSQDIVEGIPATRVTKQKCINPKCDNEDPNNFRPSRGGVIACIKCGDCQSDFVIHEGEMFRNFSGEEDRSHHGPALNTLYSSSYNLGTQFTGLRGGKRSTGRETDFSVSNVGKDGSLATRVEYKDDQKSRAFRLMREQVANLALHELVRKKAEELFAAYRNARDRLYDFEAVVAACLIAGQLTVFLEEQGDAIKPLQFACPKCGSSFTTKKEAEKHCMIRVVSSGEENSEHTGLEDALLAGRVSGKDESLDPEIHKMEMEDVRAVLLWMTQGEYHAEVQGICRGLEQQLQRLGEQDSASEAEEEAGREDANGLGQVGSIQGEGGRHLRAGQVLCMTNAKVLTRWCKGNAEVGKFFYDYIQGVKRRKRERDGRAEEEIQDRKRLREKPLDDFAII